MRGYQETFTDIYKIVALPIENPYDCRDSGSTCLWYNDVPLFRRRRPVEQTRSTESLNRLLTQATIFRREKDYEKIICTDHACCHCMLHGNGPGAGYGSGTCG
jgi:hypothetical protein